MRGDFNNDLFPTNSTWDRPGWGHLRRVKTQGQQPTISWALRKQTHPDPTTIGAFRSFTFPRTGIDIPHHWIDQTTTRRRNIQCLSLSHQVKNTKSRPMLLVITWVCIIESKIDPMIPAPSNYEGCPRNGHNRGDEIPSLRKCPNETCMARLTGPLKRQCI